MEVNNLLLPLLRIYEKAHVDRFDKGQRKGHCLKITDTSTFDSFQKNLTKEDWEALAVLHVRRKALGKRSTCFYVRER